MIPAILIDPINMSVDPIDLPDGSLESMRTALAFQPGQHFDSVTLTEDTSRGRLVMWVDDEGLFVQEQFFFAFVQNLERIYAGPALVTRVDLTGETRGIPNRDKYCDAIRETTAWMPVTFKGMKTSEGKAKHPLFGEMFQIKSEARFKLRKPREGELGWSTATDAPYGMEG